MNSFGLNSLVWCEYIVQLCVSHGELYKLGRGYGVKFHLSLWRPP